MVVRTRFAPSPTGVLHLGSVRTALYCWLFARHHGGRFVLRIEDTDTERSTKESVNAILEGLEWLELDADEGPYYQSERFDRYAEVIEEWLSSGIAYRCYCSREELEKLREEQIASGENPRYDGRCRDRKEPRQGVDPVVRFRMPGEGSVVVDDLVRGAVAFNNRELDDLVIARSSGVPTYNFTVVVDDADMNITHVIRGDDHLNNTPKQIHMLRALGRAEPRYAHLPMILGPDGAKLSKRHGAVNILDYRSMGYLPVAMLNYLVRLGWSHGDQEVFSMNEMIELFDIGDVNASASAFNPEKLLWLNQQHIIGAAPEKLGQMLEPFLLGKGYDLAGGPSPQQVASAFRERARTLAEMAEACAFCYEDVGEFEPAAAKKHLRPALLDGLRGVRNALAALERWDRTAIHDAISESAAASGTSLGKIGQPLRVAVTGKAVSPPLDVTLELVGQARTISRLDAALEFMADRRSAR